MKLTENYREELLKRLRKNPEFARAYLNECLKNPDDGAFLLAFRDVAEAYGFKKLAGKSHITREHLFRMLSKKGNPRLSSFRRLLNAFGWSLTLIRTAKSTLAKAA